jgi:hypothetical protein
MCPVWQKPVAIALIQISVQLCLAFYASSKFSPQAVLSDWLPPPDEQ